MGWSEHLYTCRNLKNTKVKFWYGCAEAQKKSGRVDADSTWVYMESFPKYGAGGRSGRHGRFGQQFMHGFCKILKTHKRTDTNEKNDCKGHRKKCQNSYYYHVMSSRLMEFEGGKRKFYFWGGRGGGGSPTEEGTATINVGTKRKYRGKARIL